MSDAITSSLNPAPPRLASEPGSSIHGKRIKRLLLSLALCGAASTGLAQDYPSRAITIAAPNPPSGKNQIHAQPLSAILSKQPLGEVAVLKPEEWNGVWIYEGAELYRLAVIDADKGVLGGRDACDPSSPYKQLNLRQSGSWYTESTPGLRGGPESIVGLYEITHLSFRDGHALFSYEVDAKRIRALVEQGALPGRIENNNVILGTLTPQHYRVLLPENKDSKEAPPVLWRSVRFSMKLPEELDPCKKGELQATR
jgi:hypothetical protein